MDSVGPGLFVGTIEDAANESLLHDRDITSIISLTHREPNGGFPAETIVVNIPMIDGPQNDQMAFQTAVIEVLKQLESGERILIHCTAGASRSPAIAATALALHRNIELNVAFDRIKSRRPPADPHEALIHQARRVYTEIGE